MLAASGAGAIVGSFVTAMVERHRGAVWFASAAAMAAGVIVLGAVHSFTVALCVLVVIGLSVLAFAGTSNILLQTLSPAEMRGRAISVFSMIILGGIPAGSLLLGSFATLVGLPSSLVAGGAAGLAISAWVWSRNAALRAV